MSHYMPTQNARRTGYADRVMGRPCKSPWANLGYKAIRNNSEYILGFMEADKIMESKTYYINGTEYYVDYYDGGYAWKSDDNESACFDTPLEALQAAIDHEQAKADAETQALEDAIDERKYGSFEDQVYSQYRGGIL